MQFDGLNEKYPSSPSEKDNLDSARKQASSARSKSYNNSKSKSKRKLSDPNEVQDHSFI